MPSSLIRLDPALPVCWEDQQTLRLGFDRAEVSVSSPSAATQRLISALITGIRSDHLSLVLRRIGSSRAEWSRLADMLGDSLIVSPADGADPPPARLRVGLIAPGAPWETPIADALLSAIARAGWQAEPFSPARKGYGLVVVAERFLDPRGAGRLTSSGLAQLSIRFGDRSVGVGPLAEGGGRPCLGCVNLHDIDRDPALPMLAAQLLGEVPASETSAAAEAAAALAVALIGHWRAGSDMPGRTRLRVPVRAGLPLPSVEAEEVSAHPECGCGLQAAGERIGEARISEARISEAQGPAAISAAEAPLRR